MGDINELHELLQNLTPRIKFTMEHSLKELPFLEMLIKNVNGEIITDIYHEPTDSQQYLHLRSYHHQNCMKYIPYTLTRRIHTIITTNNKNNPEIFTEIMKNLEEIGKGQNQRNTRHNKNN